MPHLTPNYDWTELPARDRWAAEDNADTLPLIDRASIPAPASQFNIQNFQQWIDLCA
jgi:hypothetical protein